MSRNMSAWLAAAVTEAQLLLAGLASGVAIIGVVIRALVNSPERESDAYRRGVADEASRCAEDIGELRAEYVKVEQRMSRLHDALLRFLVASDLTPTLRAEIAAALGSEGRPAPPATP